MFCSTIIPTIARPSLDRAVESVLAQELEGDAFEVIVVNDSGAPLIPAPWHSHDQVRIIDTRQREKCFARNTGAAVARGRYLNFLDDDDWLLPGAFAAFRDYIRKNGEAKVLYGNVLYVDVCEEVIGELNLGR
ncbi:MAG: glycosyltransferase family 2 protein, partial [Anaerolineae bacterium]|nr:glycosyltransferase family 2 protein [Anaerolineae bacterium]